MYDPEMKYCLKCNDEYMPEKVQCGVCGASLLSGHEVLKGQTVQQSKLTSRKGALMASDDIVTIFRGSLDEVKRIEAKMVPENIGTMVVGESDGGCGKGCCSPTQVELRVRREDAKDAAQIIENDFVQMTGFADFQQHLVDTVYDPSAKESVCPACGTQFSSADHVCPDCGLCFG